MRTLLSAFVAALLTQSGALLPPAGGHHPLVCAHRGHLRPAELENSVATMKHTLKNGIEWIEFDLRQSKDGVVFLCHDTTLDRTTNLTGPVAAYTAEELSHALLRDSSGRVSGEHLNRFEDLLIWAEGNHVKLLVDLKDTPPARAAKAIRAHGLQDRAILLTFDQPTAAAAFSADQKMMVSTLVKSQADIDAALAAAHGHALALYLPQSADHSLYLSAHATNLFTLTDTLGSTDTDAEIRGPLAYERFLETRPVNLVVTNHPVDLQIVTASIR